MDRIRFVQVWFVYLLLIATGVQARTVTDALGRAVMVPDFPRRIFASTQLGTTLLYTLNSERLIGRNSAPSKAEQGLLDPAFLALPVLGSWSYAGSSVNSEAVLQVNPDLIVVATFLPSRREATLAEVSRMEQVLKIPVLVVDGTLEALPHSYRVLGLVLGETARAEMLAQYAESTLAEIRERASTVPEDQVVRVYYADGNDGFMTSPSGTIHTRLIDLVGAQNVSTVRTKKGGNSRCRISPEQLLIWNPDLIIAYHASGTSAEDSTWRKLQSDARLKTLAAVKNRQIYEAPCRPFNLMDHPPTLNRLLGLKWMGHLLYPDVYPYDLSVEVADFYRLFYRIEMTSEQALAALGEAAGRR
jgi:iron complex transport system substrate-binding protein